jgi:hypothetical protein
MCRQFIMLIFPEPCNIKHFIAFPTVFFLINTCKLEHYNCINNWKKVYDYIKCAVLKPYIDIRLSYRKGAFELLLQLYVSRRAWYTYVDTKG